MTLAVVSMLISILVALFSYFYQLDSATKQSHKLASQIAAGSERAAAIAAYIKDIELAEEILTGLKINDLISNAFILDQNNTVLVGSQPSSQNNQNIVIDLFNPFLNDNKVGQLVVQPNMRFIGANAKSASLQIALLLLCLSLVTAIIVGLFIRKQLTNPLQRLVNSFLNIDISKPDKVNKINIGYKRDDEIFMLINQLNTLVDAHFLKFQSEHLLRKETEKLQNQFRLIFEQTNAGIGLMNHEGKVVMANPAIKDFFQEDITGKHLPSYFHQPEKLGNEIKKLFEKNTYLQVSVDLIAYTNKKKRYFNCLLSTIDDDRHSERENADQLFEIVIHDVTLRRESEEKAQYEAGHDELTGLLNRRSGTDALDDIIAISRSELKLFALFLIDLDKFKPINDTLGHDIGDQVLSLVSERLIVLLSPFKSTCIRWGGDEFVIGYAAQTHEEIESLAKETLSYIKSPMTINTHQDVTVGASIGCIYQDFSRYTPSAGLERYIKKADSLMYDVKNSGKDSYKIQSL